jgi:hypothetical protein
MQYTRGAVTAISNREIVRTIPIEISNASDSRSEGLSYDSERTVVECVNPLRVSDGVVCIQH